MTDETMEATKDDTTETSTSDPPEQAPTPGDASEVDDWRDDVTRFLGDSHERMTALESKLDKIIELVSSKPEAAAVTEEKTEIEPAEEVATEEAAKPSKRLAGILW
ncbi:MAG: hypothetical protein ACYCSN_13500 [Acidobacteriaceae bacterium]